MSASIGHRLEQYTIKRPSEVLIVSAEIDGEADTVMIFKGYSSSLMRPTAFDPDVPILPEGAKILAIDRAVSPYDPDNPQFIERGLSWDTIQPLLSEVGV
jgi:hypothetical protein